MTAKQISSQSKAIAMLRKLIPMEGYFQTEIKKKLKQKYPDAFIRKINQGHYSEGGIPDIMFIYHGHYFGFEVKRPVVGEPSKLQLRTIDLIRKAGGTADVVVYPEDCIEIIERWEVENDG